MDNWLFEIEKNAVPNVTKMIFANKSDLEKKEVTKEMGEEYAAKNKLLFTETSAKKDMQISAAFEQISSKLIDLKYFLCGK